jgi:hypothetical protein
MITIDMPAGGQIKVAGEGVRLDSSVWFRYVTQQDGAVRPAHAKLHGTIWRLDDPNAPIPPLDYGCFLPGTRISAIVDGGSRALYHGEAVEIVTKSGRRVRVTPNHPTPTARGLVPAGEIARGEQVLVHDPEAIRVLRGQVDENNMTPTVEQVFNALAERGPVRLANPSPHDFHGDGQAVHGKVEVVGSYAELWDDWNSKISQVPENREFSHTHGSLLERHVGPLDALLLARSAPDTGISNHPRDHVPRELEFIGYTYDGHTLTVDRQELLAGDAGRGQHLVGLPPDCDACLREPDANKLTLNPDFLGEILDGCAGSVALDEVVDVRRFEYSGHVYDFRSPRGYIIANHIVQGNCRCGIEYVAQPGSAAAEILPEADRAPEESPPADDAAETLAAVEALTKKKKKAKKP